MARSLSKRAEQGVSLDATRSTVDPHTSDEDEEAEEEDEAEVVTEDDEPSAAASDAARSAPRPPARTDSQLARELQAVKDATAEMLLREILPTAVVLLSDYEDTY